MPASGRIGGERAGYLRRAFPLLLESRVASGGRAGGALVLTDFLAGFSVAYALREEGKRIVPVTSRLARDLRLEPDALHAAAIGNLERDCASAEFRFFDSEEGGVVLFDGENELHSSRLLHRNLYGYLQKLLRGPFIVGVPNRDVMIAVAEKNQTVLDGLAGDLEASYRARRHPLTLKIFRVAPGGVALLG